MASKKGVSRGVEEKKKPSLGVVFAEHEHDAQALIHLTRAIWNGAPPMQYRRKPLVLVAGQANAAARKKNAADIAAVVKADAEVRDVRIVIAHRDCDAPEDAHLAASKAIRKALLDEGVKNVAPATPAWEIEAWWYLWPEAVATVCTKWRKLKRTGNHGTYVNAKEKLTRDLRAKGVEDYEEKDSIPIAMAVNNLKLVDQRTGSSASFMEFRRRVRVAAKLENSRPDETGEFS